MDERIKITDHLISIDISSGSDILLPEAKKEYDMEAAKCKTADAARNRLFKKALLSTQVSIEEKNFLQLMVIDSQNPALLSEKYLGTLKSPEAVEIGASLIDASIADSNARRMMELIIRNNNYDVSMQIAEETQQEMRKMTEEQKALAETSRKEKRKYEFMVSSSKVNLKQKALESMRVMDKGFMKAFNGPMLDIIHKLEAAKKILSGRHAADSPAIAAKPPILRTSMPNQH